MNAADNAITDLLHGSTNQYLLIRVGSSISSSEDVLPGDLDYVCILSAEARLKHEEELAAMIGSFANVDGVVGFVPKWPEDDWTIPGIMRKRLRGFHIDFHFGPVASGGLDAMTHAIHFAGPITLGDYEFFRRAHPVLAFSFETYHKCLLGDTSVICSQTKRPSIEHFVRLTILNCERFRRAPNVHLSHMAIKKILLLRAIWQASTDPYRSSRLDLMKIKGRESDLVDYTVRNTEQLLDFPEAIEHLLTYTG